MRLKIYYLIVKLPQIQPVSGDRITELSIIRRLSKYHDVYYNNQLIDFSKPNLGQKNKKAHAPDRNYDIYWIRNNDNLLLKCNGIKVRVAQPYNEQAYENIDILVTQTVSWKKKMLKYNNSEYEESNNIYPKHNIHIPKYILPVVQTVPDFFKPCRDKKKIARIRKELVGDADFIIGHFGRIMRSCYPFSLIHILPRVIEKYKHLKIKLILCDNSQRIKIDTTKYDFLETKYKIPYNEMPDYISAVDLITSDYRAPTANWSGCMHVLEAMACEVPILCGDFDVRKEQLGEDYPLFWKYVKNTGRLGEEAEEQIFNNICKVIDNRNGFIGTIKKGFRKRIQVYRDDYQAKILHTQLVRLYKEIKQNKS
jgi:glycosyltransferase involved in cell wall biosynthesis